VTIAKGGEMMIKMLEDALLEGIPGIYESVDVPFPEKIVKLHIFRENADWFIVEYDSSQRLFYGYANVRPGSPGWGCFALDEIANCHLPSFSPDAELDLRWRPKKAKEIQDILGGE
jgi:hypothetical protein